MKKLVLAIALLLGCVGIANAQCSGNCIQFTNSASSCSTSTSSCALTVTSTGAGHAGVIGIYYANGSSQTVTSVTDNQSNTWVNAFNLVNLGSHKTEALFYVCNLTAGTTTITANYPTAGASFVGFVELKNIASSSCLDVNTSNGNNALSQNFSGTTATTTNATDTFIGMAYNDATGSATYAAGTGSGGTVWTNVNGANTGIQVGGFTSCQTMFYATTTTTVTDNLVYTGSVTSSAYYGDYAAFKGSSTTNSDGGTTIAQKESPKEQVKGKS